MLAWADLHGGTRRPHRVRRRSRRAATAWSSSAVTGPRGCRSCPSTSWRSRGRPTRWRPARRWPTSSTCATGSPDLGRGPELGCEPWVACSVARKSRARDREQVALVEVADAIGGTTRGVLSWRRPRSSRPTPRPPRPSRGRAPPSRGLGRPDRCRGRQPDARRPSRALRRDLGRRHPRTRRRRCWPARTSASPPPDLPADLDDLTRQELRASPSAGSPALMTCASSSPPLRTPRSTCRAGPTARASGSWSTCTCTSALATVARRRRAGREHRASAARAGHGSWATRR